MNRKFVLRSASLVMSAMLAVSGFAQDQAADRLDPLAKKDKAAAPSAVGAWFGIARPCPADSATDSAVHVAFCQAVCGTCTSIPGTLPPEVPMMPTMLSDGTVIADDAGEIARFHTTAHGHWEASKNDGLPDWQGLTPREGNILLAGFHRNCD